MSQRKLPRPHVQNEEQRKLAAIMFADLVGYGSLVQRNEQLAPQLLDEHKRLLRSIFPKHHGKEVKTIGDAFLIEFARALDATRCAIDIQKSIHQRNERSDPGRVVHVRIGLHVGNIIYRENDVFGDGVNIASRIEPLAGPGGICLSEDVARPIQNKLDYPVIKLGRGDLKNTQVPVEIYKILLPWQHRRFPFSHRMGFLLRQRRSRMFATVMGLLLLMIGVSWMIFENYVPRLSPETGRPEKSVAVLPFQNVGEEAQDDYLVDGITESLITDVARIPGLFVIARNSVFQYKGKPVKVRSVGRELNVRYVLEGSVQRAGNKLRVIAQLIDAMTENLVWGNKFDQEMKDIFAVQDSISMSVVYALRVTLSALEETKLKVQRTSNIDALELYWKGQTHSRRRTKTDNDQALQYLSQALERDPKYADAHATVASALRFRYGFERNRAILDRVRLHVAAALELHPNHSEAMLVRGFLQKEDGNLADAIQTLLKEYQLYPNDAECLYYLGNAYRDMGDLLKAVEFHKYSFDIDPLYFFNAYNLAIDYWELRQIDKLSFYSEKALSIDPSHFLGLIMRGYTFAFQGKVHEAIESMSKAIASEPNHLDSYGARAIVFIRFGKFDEAMNDLGYLLERDPNSLLGLAYAVPLFLNLGKLAEAERIIENSLQGPILPMAQGIDYSAFLLTHRGLLKREQGKQTEARKSFREARNSIERNLARFPQSPTLHSLYGLILACSGEFAKGASEVEKAIAGVPSRYDFVFDLARVHGMSGNKTRMLQSLRKAIDAGGRDFEFMKSDIFLKKFRYDPNFLSLFEAARNKYLVAN